MYISSHIYNGLRLLKSLPALTTLDLIEVDLRSGDFEKLQNDLPKVKVTHAQMTPPSREKGEREAAKK